MQLAIEHALVILSWFENRPPDEIPKEHLWEDPKGLEAWWERIKNRKEFAKGRPGATTKELDEEIVENDLVRAFKG